jgi:hypothetical protein
MWYVGDLLIHGYEIKEQGDIDSNVYIDLLTLEQAIKRLYSMGVLTTMDLIVLNKYISLEDLLGISVPDNKYKTEQLFDYAFINLCSKLGASLGGMFTDAGYLNYMKQKHNLAPDQLKKLESYMLSPFRHKLMRKPYKENINAKELNQ